MDITDILSRLDKKTQQRVMAAQDVAIEKVPLASYTLTKGLKGGIGKGRQTLVWGNKSAGKSSLCLETIADAQKNGQACAWIDAEASFDPEWAQKLGVDTSQLIVSPVKSISDFTLVGCELMEAGIDVLVADSISALLPSTYFEKEDEMKDGLEGTKQIGTVSKELGIAVNKFNYVNKNTALILISQARNKFNTYGAALKPMGGESMMYFSSTIVKLWSSASEREQIVDEVTYGNRIVKMPIARPVTWTIEYNKIGPPMQVGNYNFHYQGDFVGVDNIGEIASMAVDVGIVGKGGAWYSYEDQKFQGERKLIDWLRNNPDIQEKLLKEVYDV